MPGKLLSATLFATSWYGNDKAQLYLPEPSWLRRERFCSRWQPEEKAAAAI
jgi:hypothetical protein